MLVFELIVKVNGFDLMDILFKFLLVTGIGIAELWAAIPAGIALNLHPVLNGFASMLGGIIGILLVAVIGNRLRDWLLRNKNKKDKPKGKIYVIWEKYGVVGLGILAPVLTGALLGKAIGMTFGVPKGRLIMWMSIGVVLWSIVLTTLASMGFAGFEQIVG